MELEFHLTLHCRKCMCLAPSLNTQVPVSGLKRKEGRNAGTVDTQCGHKKGVQPGIFPAFEELLACPGLLSGHSSPK